MDLNALKSVIKNMLYEEDALDELLETLEPELKNQLKFLIFQFENMPDGAMASDKIKKWEQEENLREIFQSAEEFFCRGRKSPYSYKNEYVAGVKREAAKMGFSLKSKIYQKNCFYDGARRNLSALCWLLESGDGKIEFYEDEKSEAVKILFFATADGGAFFQLKRLVGAARKLLLTGGKNLIYGSVLEKEADEYPFESKSLLKKNLGLKSDGLSRLHHLYFRLGAKTLNDDLICWRS
jgi:hypothetical protein